MTAYFINFQLAPFLYIFGNLNLDRDGASYKFFSLDALYLSIDDRFIRLRPPFSLNYSYFLSFFKLLLPSYGHPFHCLFSPFFLLSEFLCFASLVVGYLLFPLVRFLFRRLENGLVVGTPSPVIRSDYWTVHRNLVATSRLTDLGVHNTFVIRCPGRLPLYFFFYLSFSLLLQDLFFH